MSKRLPKMKGDRAAKQVLKKDLSDYLSPENFKLTSFEFAPKPIREAIEQFLKKAA